MSRSKRSNSTSISVGGDFNVTGDPVIGSGNVVGTKGADESVSQTLPGPVPGLDVEIARAVPALSWPPSLRSDELGRLDEYRDLLGRLLDEWERQSVPQETAAQRRARSRLIASDRTVITSDNPLDTGEAVAALSTVIAGLSEGEFAGSEFGPFLAELAGLLDPADDDNIAVLAGSLDRVVELGSSEDLPTTASGRARSMASRLAWLPSRSEASVGAGFVTIGSAAAQAVGLVDPLVGTFGLATGAVAGLLACLRSRDPAE